MIFLNFCTFICNSCILFLQWIITTPVLLGFCF